jgi:opacity protein-like surface antigen
MHTTLKAGLTVALAATASIAVSGYSLAADLYGGSMKDGGYAPAYRAAPSLAGPCYARGDIGYSWNTNPSARYVGNGADPDARHEQIDGGMLTEVGLGCSSGSRGLRADLTLGFRSNRDFKGDIDIVPPGGGSIDPPVKTSIDTYTVMFNAYYDLGQYRGFVPYVGAGVGLALHDMGYVTFDDPLSPNPQHGDTKADLAWSLMAGVGYQISANTILDVGYRYINMGSAQSSQGDVAQYMNPKLVVSDIAAHEFKVGLRYHFGTSSSCCDYASVK